MLKHFERLGEEMSELPLLTMTKARLIETQPELDPPSESLLSILAGLCSFHTCEDLASFLFTDKFRNLVGNGEPWIVFEVGIYKDHTLTLETIPVRDGITFADASMSGSIPEHVIIVKSEAECTQTLTNWYNHLMNG